MIRTFRSFGLLLLATALVGACTTQRVGPSSSDQLAGMAPVLSVERFLQAVNTRDFDAMASLFGTVGGPLRGDRQEIEIRMATIAEILRHDDYQIVSEQRAAGREHPTNRIGVTLTRGGQTFRDVPFMVVQTSDGDWLVEEIDLESVTGS